MLDDLFKFLPQGFLHRELLTAHIVLFASALFIGLSIPMTELLRGMKQVKVIAVAYLAHAMWMAFVAFNLGLAVYDDRSTIKGLVILACVPISLFSVTIASVARLYVPAVFAAVMLSSISHDIFGNLDISLWDYLFADSNANIRSINLESRSAAVPATIFLAAPLMLGSAISMVLSPRLRRLAEMPVMLVAVALVTVAAIASIKNADGVIQSFMHAGMPVIVGYPLVLSGVFSMAMIAGLSAPQAGAVVLAASLTNVPYAFLAAYDNFFNDYSISRPMLWWELVQLPCSVALAFALRHVKLYERTTTNSDSEAAIKG